MLVILIYYAACSGTLGCMCAKTLESVQFMAIATVTRSRIYYTRKHHCCLCCAVMGCCSTANLPTICSAMAVPLKVGHRYDLQILSHWCTQSLLEICIANQNAALLPSQKSIKLSFTHCANMEDSNLPNNKHLTFM